MMLIIVCSINANDNILLLAWALVPIENKEQQTYFLAFLSDQFDVINKEDCIFISDRDKGIAAAISSQFPIYLSAYCCQHIADSV